MGFYINPRDGRSKEQWLIEEGIYIKKPCHPPVAGQHYVCLVDNGGFTAAGIAYCEEERMRFARCDDDPTDNRPRFWFTVADEKLLAVTPEVPLA